MSGSKHFNKITWVITALMLVVTIVFMNGSKFGIETIAHSMGYENRLFDNSKVHTIDIVMDDWDTFIENATSEEYYAAAVVIDGEAYKNIGIRGKGNTSLSTVSSMESDRYSFKVEFDHYDNSITYHGLDKLSLNNLIQDSTMMKDYLTYTMMNEFGVASPLCSFVYITVNGEDWGLYLAVEGVEDSFLERNYGSSYGELYKPDSVSFGGGRGNGKEFNMDDFMNREGMSDSIEKSEEGAMRPQMQDRGGNNPIQWSNKEDKNPENRDKFLTGGFGMGSSDVKLQYIDDNISSYSNIWDNAKTDITETDKTRLISSLEKLSNGEQLDSVVDIEQVIRYFVVHNYVCNGDSYTGAMIHNYYLYEENGQMEMIPWDYNLAFGTFQGGDGQTTVNTPIDAPVSGGMGEDRPMWNWILSDERYTELYHQYFKEFLNTVDIKEVIDNAYNLIKPYVEKDPTSFYTYAEFETGVETMRKFCELRSESIHTQLSNGETTTNMNYVDASALTLSNMGSMSGKGGFGGQMPNMGEIPEGFDPSQMPDEFNGQMPSMGEMPEGFDPSQMPGGFNGQMPSMGEMPEGFDTSQMPGGFNGQMPNMEEMPEDMFNSNVDIVGNGINSSANIILLILSAIVLLIGLIIVKLYKY